MYKSGRKPWIVAGLARNTFSSLSTTKIFQTVSYSSRSANKQELTMSRSEESVTLSEQDQQQHLLEEDHPNRLQLERKMKPMQQDEALTRYHLAWRGGELANQRDNAPRY